MKRLRVIFLIGLVVAMTGCTGRPDGVEPVKNFDINGYQGVWYEIMRLDHSFERGLSNVTATYELRDDGTVSVLNRGFNSEECEWSEAEGVAEFQGDQTVASLSVTFFWPFAGGYHVFELDQENYTYAAVSGPSKEYLWLLARQPKITTEIRNQLVRKAAQIGFPVENLILVDHGKPSCEATGS